ncbi:MAG: HK97 gp10 family phage protein [Acidimicrobiia bacterium]
MGARIEVDTADLRRALREIGDAGLKKALRDANKTAAQVVVDRALPNVPAVTGRLKASVRALGAQKEAKVAAGTAKVDYAAAVHWGRLRGNVGSPPGNRMSVNVVRGRPFLWNAAEAARRDVVDVYEREMDRLLDKVRNR